VISAFAIFSWKSDAIVRGDFPATLCELIRRTAVMLLRLCCDLAAAIVIAMLVPTAISLRSSFRVALRGKKRCD